jgi:hypothetical protein
MYGCTENSLVSGGVEAGNPRVIGSLLLASGTPADAAIVRLIPKSYVPDSGKSLVNASIDTTDNLGRYTLPCADTGTFTLLGFQPSTGKRVIIQNIKAEKGRTTTVSDDSVRDAGTALIIIPDSLRKAGARVAVLGTTFSASITNDTLVAIDSLPAGVVPSIIYVAPLAAFTKTIAQTLNIVAHDTTRVSALLARTVLIQPGGDLQQSINSLLPGDTLFLAGGVYHLTGVNVSVSGNGFQPILIAAVIGEIPVLVNTAASNNTINILGAHYVTIEGIEIDSTQNGVDGIKFAEEGTSSNIIIRTCTIHNILGTGINAQGSHHNITITSNHIHSVIGSQVAGIRVGPGTSILMPHDWLIAGNWIHDCGDSNSSASFGISLIAGCFAMTIRDNVVYATASSGIINYGVNSSTSDISLAAIIEGNAVWNAAEGISAYCDAVVRNNIIFNCQNPVYSYNYQGTIPRNVLIYNNTMYNGVQPYLRSWDSMNNCAFVNNAVYLMSGGLYLNGNGRISNNVGDFNAVGFTVGSSTNDLSGPANRDFYPKVGSLLVNRGQITLFSANDFNATARDLQPDVGAYEFTGNNNPGWMIGEGFKK